MGVLEGLRDLRSWSVMEGEYVGEILLVEVATYNMAYLMAVIELL